MFMGKVLDVIYLCASTHQLKSSFKCLHECVTDISMPIDRLTSAVTWGGGGAMSKQIKNNLY